MTTIDVTTRAAREDAAAPPASGPDRLVETLFTAVLGAQQVQAVYLGDRLGWYRALAEGGPLTARELAERTGTVERYAREWLEHQAATGYVTVDDVAAPPAARRFGLRPGAAEVLTDVDSLDHLAPLARFVAGVGRHLDAVCEAYRAGGGVSWAELGDDARQAQAALNRPLLLHRLGTELLPSVPELDAALRAPGARVADVGCGFGWSSIGIARAYPGATVDGFDVDAPSVEAARRHAAEAGVADRVRFHEADAAEATGRYDVVFAFECIHDLPDPVAVLAAMRRLAGNAGLVVVMDENVGERFCAPAPELEQLLYGFSITCCLPDAMSHTPSVATGTVMRPDTLAEYARRAGFDRVETLPLGNDLFRFYRLR